MVRCNLKRLDVDRPFGITLPAHAKHVGRRRKFPRGDRQSVGTVTRTSKSGRGGRRGGALPCLSRVVMAEAACMGMKANITGGMDGAGKHGDSRRLAALAFTLALAFPGGAWRARISSSRLGLMVRGLRALAPLRQRRFKLGKFLRGDEDMKKRAFLTPGTFTLIVEEANARAGYFILAFRGPFALSWRRRRSRCCLGQVGEDSSLLRQ